MRKILLALCLASFALNAYSQENSFDQRLSSLRKVVITICSRLQTPGEGETPERLAAAVDSLTTGWSLLKMNFMDNPPAEYAQDPAWKSYFSEAGENFGLMRARAAEGNYKRAVQFCGQNCALFVKIHQVNGRETVTDRLFAIRQAIKTSQAMVAAGNTKGAVGLLKKHTSSFDNMPLAAGEKRGNVQQDIRSLKKGYQALISAVAKQNKDISMKEYNGYLKTFNQIYADNI